MSNCCFSAGLVPQKLGAGHSMALRLTENDKCKGIHSYGEKSSLFRCNKRNIEPFQLDGGPE